VISDLELLKPRDRTHESLEKVALRWEGHQWSDELTSFLQANRARTVEEFRRAFKDYGVSGQNMLAVDRSGNIGHVLAVRLPDRQVDEPRSYWMSPQELTSSARNALSLPFNKNPREGILVSSNDRPFEGAPSVGLFFSPKDRHDRIEQQLLGRRDWTTQDLTQLQQDTYSHPSYLLVQRLCQAAILKNLPESEVLCSWSGSFESSSRGALLFQLWLFYFAPMRLKQLYPESIAQVLNQSDYLRARLLLTWSDNPDVRDVAVKQAWKQALDKAQDVKDWGSLHRLELGHPLANAPLIGSSFRYWEGPVSGGVETVFKTAHDWTDQKHKARYGTNARHLSDMADLDANEFVLMGGNDGWIGSANQADQLPLLLEGKSLRMPLRVETIRREFPIVSTRR
jgi:penicillin amidase